MASKGKLQFKTEIDDKFLEFLVDANEIKMRTLDGTENQESFSSVLKQQSGLQTLLEELRVKFHQRQHEWDLDFAKEQRRITSYDSDSDNDGHDAINTQRKKTKETVL